MLTVLGGIAQFERVLMLQRCNEGRDVAMSKGVKIGRTRIGGKQLEYSLELHNKGEMPISKICDVTGIAKATLCSRIKEFKEVRELDILS